MAVLSAVLTRPTMGASLGKVGLRKRLGWLIRGSWVLRNPRTLVQVVQVLTSPQARPLLRTEPRLMFKYLFGYVATPLSRAERASMLIHHYALLGDWAEQNFFSRIVERRLELWQLIVGANVYRIGLSFPLTADGEGDLALFFQSNEIDIYTLSFTIGPGSVAGLSSDHAMYIARVQGRGNGLDEIRIATKECHDISPAALLLAAAEGIAQALDLNKMVGIGAASHIATTSGHQPQDLFKAYDEFWTAAGGLPLPRSMYQLPVPSVGKSILAVKRDHRSRTQRKRRFKKAVVEQVRKAFRDAALRNTDTAPSELEAY